MTFPATEPIFPNIHPMEMAILLEKKKKYEIVNINYYYDEYVANFIISRNTIPFNPQYNNPRKTVSGGLELVGKPLEMFINTCIPSEKVRRQCNRLGSCPCWTALQKWMLSQDSASRT